LTASRKRGRPRKLTIESKQDDEEDEEDVKEDEEMTEKSRESTAEPRQYQLRTIKPPVDRYDGRPIRKAAPVMFSRQRFINNPGNRRSLREKRKRRSRSSSTSSSSDEELTNAKRDAKDEAKFQRRLMRSMNQSRQNLLPINMTEKDLSGSKHLVKERLRQIGQVGGNSCTDIDPMGIDKAVGFDSVGGCTSHLQSLKETVLFPLVYPELFEKFKITPPKGILFYGPPGTGKTLIARALANECSQGDKKVAFFMRKGADCLSKWIGESERQLRLLFDQAYSMRPSIIFFDEIDGLAPVRSSRQDQIHSSIVSTLLALMDGLDARGEVVVIGATNRLDSIDPALRRPGRFDRELRFSLPDKTARRSILDSYKRME
jgi:ATP-dependent Zn protease